MVSSFWKNKKVFLTGHTGFKGSWMSLWLLKAGANLTGYSLGLPTQPSLFKELDIAKDLDSVFADIRDLEKIKKSVLIAKPDIIIHMAAQPLVRYSYQEPVETYMTNVMGSIYLFEAVRASGSVKAVLNVTSDKCYENQEREAGYREFEPMGGYDPYSNSKGCAELVTSAYRKSFFEKEDIFLASGRAGNVIGGGDWATDRLVPDIVRSALYDKKLIIRNPKAIRPWQHVLEPVSGYLRLTEKLYTEGKTYAEAFNFGPLPGDRCDVENIVIKMNEFWDNKIKYEITRSGSDLHEAHILGLDCTKAEKVLNWKPQWNLEKALKATVMWNRQRLARANVRDICLEQIKDYEGQSNV